MKDIKEVLRKDLDKAIDPDIFFIRLSAQSFKEFILDFIKKNQWKIYQQQEKEDHRDDIISVTAEDETLTEEEIDELVLSFDEALGKCDDYFQLYWQVMQEVLNKHNKE